MCKSFAEAAEELYGKEWVEADRAKCAAARAEPDPTQLHRWFVFVDVDNKGGDNDVFQVRVSVVAYTKCEAYDLGEALADARYGRHKVLGAYDGRLAEDQTNLQQRRWS
jgi:hypothetical protein